MASSLRSAFDAVNAEEESSQVQNKPASSLRAAFDAVNSEGQDQALAQAPDPAATLMSTPAPGYDVIGGIKDVGKMIYDIPVQTKGAIGALMEGGDDPYAKANYADTWQDEAKARTTQRLAETTPEERAKKIIPLPEFLSENGALTRGDIQDTSQSTGFTAAAMGAGLAGGAVGTVAGLGPWGTAAGTMAGAGTAAYKMDKSMVTRQLLEATEKAAARKLSDAERQELLDKTEDIRSNHALWEAGPEAIGTALSLSGIGKIFSGAAKGSVKKIIAGIVSNLGGELSTETITQIGQNIAEHEMGIGEGEKKSFAEPESWGQALQEVAPQVLTLSGVMGGAGYVAGKVVGPQGKEGEKGKEADAAALARNQAVLAIKQANIPTDDLIKMKSDPASLATSGISPEDIDAVINDRNADLNRAKDVLLASGESGPMTRTAALGINAEQAKIVQQREKERVDATRGRYFDTADPMAGTLENAANLLMQGGQESARPQDTQTVNQDSQTGDFPAGFGMPQGGESYDGPQIGVGRGEDSIGTVRQTIGQSGEKPAPGSLNDGNGGNIDGGQPANLGGNNEVPQLQGSVSEANGTEGRVNPPGVSGQSGATNAEVDERENGTDAIDNVDGISTGINNIPSPTARGSAEDADSVNSPIAHLIPSFDKMLSEIREGEVSKSYQNANGETSPSVTTYPDWYQQKTVSAYNKKYGTKIKLDKAIIAATIRKAKQGKPLTDRQAGVFAYMEEVAGKKAANDPELVAGQEFDKLNREGFEFNTPESITAGSIKPGDEVVIEKNGVPDKLVHKGYDAKGNAILKDGVTMRVDPFEQIQVIAKKQGESKISAGEENFLVGLVGNIREIGNQQDVDRISAEIEPYFEQNPHLAPYREMIAGAVEERRAALSRPESLQGENNTQESGDEQTNQAQAVQDATDDSGRGLEAVGPAVVAPGQSVGDAPLRAVDRRGNPKNDRRVRGEPFDSQSDNGREGQRNETKRLDSGRGKPIGDAANDSDAANGELGTEQAADSLSGEGVVDQSRSDSPQNENQGTAPTRRATGTIPTRQPSASPGSARNAAGREYAGAEVTGNLRESGGAQYQGAPATGNLRDAAGAEYSTTPVNVELGIDTKDAPPQGISPLKTEKDGDRQTVDIRDKGLAYRSREIANKPTDEAGEDASPRAESPVTELKKELQSLEAKDTKAAGDWNRIDDLKWEIYDLENGVTPKQIDSRIEPLIDKRKTIEKKEKALRAKIKKMGAMVPPPIKNEAILKADGYAAEIQGITEEISQLTIPNKSQQGATTEGRITAKRSEEADPEIALNSTQADSSRPEDTQNENQNDRTNASTNNPRYLSKVNGGADSVAEKSGQTSGQIAEENIQGATLTATDGAFSEGEQRGGVNRSESRKKKFVDIKAAKKHKFDTGSPVTVEGFHGTGAVFAEFDPSKSSAGSNGGIFFTTDKPLAEVYALEKGRVIHSNIKFDNPLVWDFNGPDDLDLTEVIANAKREGHDGVIFTDFFEPTGGAGQDFSTLYVTFNTKNISDITTPPAQANGAGDVSKKDAAGSKEARNLNAGAKDTRYEIGKSLTKQEKRKVLKTLTDVYKENNLDKEMRVDGRGEEYWAYPYRPEYFVKSDITGAMVRYYITLPGDKIAHPTELFPEYTQSKIDADLSEQLYKEKQEELAIKSTLATLDMDAAEDLQTARNNEWKRNKGAHENFKDDNRVTFYSEKEGKWHVVFNQEVADSVAPRIAERGYKQVKKFANAAGVNEKPIWSVKEYVEPKAARNVAPDIERDNAEGGKVGTEESNGIQTRTPTTADTGRRAAGVRAPAEADGNDKGRSEGKKAVAAEKDKETSETGVELYSKSSSPTQEAADAKAELSTQLGEAGLQNLLDAGTVRLLNTQDQAKQIIARYKKRNVKHSVRYSKNGKIQGFTTATKAYLVQDGIAKGNAFGVLKHELGVHLRQVVLGNSDFKALLASLEARQNEQSKAGDAIRAAMERVPESTKPEHRAEETLAYLVEMAPQTGIVRRFIALIKKSLVKLGIDPKIFTAADLSALAESVLRREARGGEGGQGVGEAINEFAQDAMMSVKAAGRKIQNLPAFKKWFDGSAVVDENGAPLVVYHGTGKQFEAFSPDVAPTNYETDKGLFHFTNFRGIAEAYSEFSGAFGEIENENPRVIEAYVALKNPLIVDNISSPIEEWDDSGDIYLKQARDEGRDGIVIQTSPTSDGRDIEKLVIAFSPTQIKSIFNSKWDGSNPDILASFAGQNAKTATKLDEAKQMKADGKPRRDVWKETGWYEIVPGSGQWSFEIDDSLSSATMREGYLEDVLTHPALFKEYPQLGKVRVRFEDMGDTQRGSFDEAKRIIRINSNFPSVIQRSSLHHEIQHSLQVNEGFATGAAMDTANKGAYWTQTGEAEARLVQARLDMPPAKRKIIPPWVTLKRMLKKEGLLKDGQKVEDVLVSNQSPKGSSSSSALSPAEARGNAGPGGDVAELGPVDVNSGGFKRWFKGSKVVDADGNPLRVYHGTAGELDGGAFSEGKIGSVFNDDEYGFFFTNSTSHSVVNKGKGVREIWDEMQSSGAYAKNAAKKTGKPANIIPAYVSLKNPFIIDSAETDFDGRSSIEYLEGRYGKDTLIEEIKAGGHDGAIIIDRNIVFANGQPETVVVALKGTQVKSALTNTGAFSDTDDRLMYSTEVAEAYDTDLQESAGMFYEKIHNKPDIPFLSKIFSTPEYNFKNFPATWKMFNAQLNRHTEKFNLENSILGDFVSVFSKAQKESKAVYEKVKAHLLEVDASGKAYRLKHESKWEIKDDDGLVVGYTLTKREGEQVAREAAGKSGKHIKDYKPEKFDTWTVIDPKGAEGDQFLDEQEAVGAMEQAEYYDMINAGSSKEEAGLVRRFRRMTNLAFDQMIADLRKIIKETDALGLPEPTVDIPDESRRYVIVENGAELGDFTTRADANAAIKIRRAADQLKGGRRVANLEVKKRSDGEIKKTVKLSEMIAMMSDLRGQYFPRQRQPGGVILRAVKGDDKIMEKFDLYITGRKHIDGETGVEMKRPMSEWLRKRFNEATGHIPFVGTLEKRARQLRAQGYDVTVEKDNKTPESVFDVVQLSSSIDALLREAVGNAKKDKQGINESAVQEINKILTANVADLFKARGYLSSRLRRSDEYWKGFEEDPLLAGTQYARGIAAGIAKRNSAKNMMAAMTGRDQSWAEYKLENPEGTWEEYDAQVEAKRLDPNKQPILHKEALGFMEEVLRNEEQIDRIVGTMKGLAVIKFLGFRVSSAMVNATNMVMGVPASISSQTGGSMTSAFNSIRKAAAAYGRYRMGRELSDEDRSIFLEITNNGWDEAQFNQENAAVLMSKLGRGWNQFGAWSMAMFGAVEKANRAMSIFAAYKEVRANTALDHDAAMEKAKHISDRAHGVYGKATLPAWARGSGNPLKLTYTFQKFSHNYMLNMIEMGLKGDKKQAAYMLLSPALMGGAGATLVTPLVAALASALGAGDGPEEEFYDWVADTFGGDSIARHGMPGAFGINLKGSIEMNNPIPTTMAELFGAPQAIIKDALKAGEYAGKGELMKAGESLLPTAVGSAIKAAREGREGLTTGSYSPVFYGDEPMKATTPEQFVRALSFNPSRISGIREKQWHEKQVAAKYNERRSEIIEKFKRYYLFGNGDYQELMVKYRRYNELVKGSGRNDITLLTMQSIKRAVARAKKPNRTERLRQVQDDDE